MRTKPTVLAVVLAAGCCGVLAIAGMPGVVASAPNARHARTAQARAHLDRARAPHAIAESTGGRSGAAPGSLPPPSDSAGNPGLAGTLFVDSQDFGARGPRSPESARREALLDLDTLSAVPVGGHVTIAGFPLDESRTVDLELDRFSVLADDAQTLIVDADGVARDAGDLGVVLLKGGVAGTFDSTVFLSVSPFGTQGYVRDAGDLFALTSGAPGTGDDLGVRVANTAGVAPRERPGEVCGEDDELMDLAAPMTSEDVPSGYADIASTAVTRECEIAIETDWQYTQSIFGGDATAAAAYIQTLVGAVSQIYERDFGTRLSLVWSRTFSADNDPYVNTDADSRLAQLKAEWDANMEDVHRDVVHMLSGMSPSWGGKAYVSALCPSAYGSSYDFGVSTHLNGSFPDPLQDHNWNNWDIMVFAHELGHNFGTGHTHDSSWYNPPIDNCGTGDCSGAYGGTIMSYCHTCSGGMSNIVLGFHPRVIDNVTFYLDFYAHCVGSVAVSACGAGDVNADGAMNLDDISLFADGVVANDLGAADCDGDNVIDMDDIRCFVDSFLAGCP